MGYWGGKPHRILSGVKVNRLTGCLSPTDNIPDVLVAPSVICFNNVASDLSLYSMCAMYYATVILYNNAEEDCCVLFLTRVGLDMKDGQWSSMVL